MTVQDNAERQEKVGLPGPKAKQAEALSQNIRWLVKKFGAERVGFLTLTVGEFEQGPFRHDRDRKFIKVQDRAEASRRFNSLLTHVIKHRYRCGVTVSERHKDGAIHFHMIVVTEFDIRTGIDHYAVFPPKNETGGYQYQPDYSTAPETLKNEWSFWRVTAEKYGFGRCNLQPIRKNGDAVGFYVAKYISKTWEHRRKGDKGARLVRYFGRWMLGYDQKTRAGTLKAHPAPWSARHGTFKPMARAWREACKQIQVVTGNRINPETVKDICGRRWSWNFTLKFKSVYFYDLPEQSQETQAALVESNRQVREGNEGELHGRPWRAWKLVTDTSFEYWAKTPETGEPDFEDYQRRRFNRRNRDFADAAAESVATFPVWKPFTGWKPVSVELFSTESGAGIVGNTAPVTGLP